MGACGSIMMDPAVVSGKLHLANLLIEGLSGIDPIVGEPAIPHWTLSLLLDSARNKSLEEKNTFPDVKKESCS